MDVILDANAYIQVLHNHGRRFLETNQFVELLTYLRRTSSRLVIPELTYNEVVARYGERLAAVAKAARDAWSTLQQVGMQQRIDFLEPDIKSELSALGKLLLNPAQGVQSVVYGDYSGVDIKEVVRRGVGRVRPANDAGEELRDVVLWLIALHYAKQSKTPIAFVSRDKTFQHTDGTLHPTLKTDVERAGVSLAFYPSIGDFVKDNALEFESLADTAVAAFVTGDELQGLAVAQLLGSHFWGGTIVDAEVLRCDFAEAQRYRVADDSHYIEVRYTGEGTIRIAPFATASVQLNPSPLIGSFPFGSSVYTILPPNEATSIDVEVGSQNEASGFAGLPPYNKLLIPEVKVNSFRCTFSIRLSMRVTGGRRESLEVEKFILLGELVPITTGAA